MNNKGLSMIELILVVIILGLLAGTSVAYLSLTKGSEVKASYQKVAHLIESTKETALGKDEAKIVFYKNADQEVVAKVITKVDTEEKSTEEVVCDPHTSFFYSREVDGSGEVQLIGTGGITIEFDRSSGALTGSMPIQFIRIQKSGYTKSMKLYKETGKLVLEN